MTRGESGGCTDLLVTAIRTRGRAICCTCSRSCGARQGGTVTGWSSSCEGNGRVQRRSLSLTLRRARPWRTLQTLQWPFNKMAARDQSQVAPPRKVTLSGEGSAVWVLEVRTLGLLANTSQQLHSNLDV